MVSKLILVEGGRFQPVSEKPVDFNEIYCPGAEGWKPIPL